MTVHKFALGALVAIGASQVFAQTDGSFDFSSVPGVGANPTVEINLNSAMLGFVTAAAGANGEDEAQEFLSGLKNIRVRVYDELEDPEAVITFIDDTSGALERDGWQRAVFIQDDEDRVHVYLKFDDIETRVTGMTVMIADDDEAVFINIAGAINPETLGHVANAMGFGGVLNAFSGGVIDFEPQPAQPPAD